MSEAYEKALYLLSYREHTGRELIDKLEKKGYPENDILEAISALKERNFLSEERFAESFIRSRLRKTAEGKGILLLRLEEKGCPRDIASYALSEAWDKREYENILKKSLCRDLKKKDRLNTVSKYLRKGFSLEEIEEVLKEIEGNEE